MAISREAMLCERCSEGHKSGQCVLCDAPFSDVGAYICDECAARMYRGRECVLCGSPFVRRQAMICRECAREHAPSFCVVCGKTA